MKWKIWAVVTAVAVVAVAALGAGLEAAFNAGRTDGRVSQLESQLSAVKAKLNSASLTGDLISCADLRKFEGSFSVTVSGQDSYGNWQTFTGSASSSWLPGHCYKS